jgi:hypothetical protein
MLFGDLVDSKMEYFPLTPRSFLKQAVISSDDGDYLLAYDFELGSLDRSDPDIKVFQIGHSSLINTEHTTDVYGKTLTVFQSALKDNGLDMSKI